jgi:hypothetical protein
MKLRVHIERLTVEGLGLAANAGQGLRAGVTAELTRLFVERGGVEKLPRAGALARIDAPTLLLPANLKPAEAGRRVAQALYEELTSARDR